MSTYKVGDTVTIFQRPYTHQDPEIESQPFTRGMT